MTHPSEVFVSRFWKLAGGVGFKLPSLSEGSAETFPDTQCRILRGGPIAKDMKQQCKNLLKGRRIPKLSVILAGEDKASHLYVRNKVKAFQEIGFHSEVHEITSSAATRDHLLQLIDKLNHDASVDGILVQLPLPSGINSLELLDHIDPSKDVDGFHPTNLGKLVNGSFTGAIPCTPLGVMLLLHAYGIGTRGKHAVVIGRSNLVGRPLASLLLASDATVTSAHRFTHELWHHTAQADILCVATGVPFLVPGSAIKPGAIVVDVGISNVNGKIVGDVSQNAIEHAGALTPVPGGVGPMTIAMLCVNTATLAWSR